VQAGTVNRWYNPNCFNLQTPGTVGNLGRNIGRGPRFVNTDIAVLKDTKLRESLTLQFRAEFFNIFNHTNLGLPVLFVNGSGAQLFVGGGGRIPNAGQITTMVGTPRQIQFALKLVF
jgi:hypothetical protein